MQKIRLQVKFKRQMKEKVCAVLTVSFTSYLCNGCSVNLCPIENCTFGIRSIERKMRSHFMDSSASVYIMSPL